MGRGESETGVGSYITSIDDLYGVNVDRAPSCHHLSSSANNSTACVRSLSSQTTIYLNFQRLVGSSIEATCMASRAAHISRANRALPPPQKASNAGAPRLPDDVARGTTRSGSSTARPILGAETKLRDRGDGRDTACTPENLADRRRAVVRGPPDRRRERCVSFPNVSIRCARGQARLRRIERLHIWHGFFAPERAVARVCRGRLVHAAGARRAREGVSRRSRGRREERAVEGLRRVVADRADALRGRDTSSWCLGIPVRLTPGDDRVPFITLADTVVVYTELLCHKVHDAALLGIK